MKGWVIAGLFIAVGVWSILLSSAIADVGGPPTLRGCLSASTGGLYNLAEGGPTRSCRSGDLTVGVSAGDVTAVFAGAGLSGGHDHGDVTLGIDPAYQLPHGCAAGDVVDSDGSGGWRCAAADVPPAARVVGRGLNPPEEEAIRWGHSFCPSQPDSVTCYDSADPSLQMFSGDRPQFLVVPLDGLYEIQVHVAHGRGQEGAWRAIELWRNDMNANCVGNFGEPNVDVAAVDVATVPALHPFVPGSSLAFSTEIDTALRLNAGDTLSVCRRFDDHPTGGTPITGDAETSWFEVRWVANIGSTVGP